MKKMVSISIILLGVMMMVLAGCKSVKTSSQGDEMTFKGTFLETKDGVYVGEVVVNDDALEKYGVNKSAFMGKEVEISGKVTTLSEGETGAALDKNGKVIYAQMRPGETIHVYKITSIKLLGNLKKKEAPGVKITETTVGEVCGVTIGVGNIFKDKDKVLRATLAFPENKTFRLAQGEYVNFKSTGFYVEKIVEDSSNGKVPGGSIGYVVLSCLPGKPYAAPEGVKAEKMNAPNS